jgi:hypothetical protein
LIGADITGKWGPGDQALRSRRVNAPEAMAIGTAAAARSILARPEEHLAGGERFSARPLRDRSVAARLIAVVTPHPLKHASS